MNPVQHKLYHVHGFHSRNFIDTYFKSGTVFEEDILHHMEKLHYLFKFANIKGGTMIDIAIGPILYHLYSACEYFREIILLRFNDHCIIELKKWLDDRTGAFDWNHASSFVTEKEGKSGQSEEKDKRLKAKITHVLKCWIDKENITDPLQLPPVDCLFIKYGLDAISKDKDDFIRNTKQFTKLLKPGGCLILFGVLNATYCSVGGIKFHIFNYDESFMRKALDEAGYVINHCEVRPRKAVSDLTDYEEVIFVLAQKKP